MSSCDLSSLYNLFAFVTVIIIARDAIIIGLLK